MPRSSKPPRGRAGALSKVHKDYIKANAWVMPAEDIAAKIGRTPEVVERFIRYHVKPETSGASPEEAAEVEKLVVRQELRRSEAWKNLKEEFVPNELGYFEEAFVKMISQMRGDVTATEETQIFHAAKYEILMSRNLKERKKCREDIDRLEKMQEDFLKKFKGDMTKMEQPDREFAMNLETQLNVSRSAESSRTNEYVKLQERHADLLKSLKSTRDQRIKEVEKSNVDYLLVVKMLARRDVQAREGRQIELMKLAGQKSYLDLGQPHTYENGDMDNPILSADTVGTGED